MIHTYFFVIIYLFYHKFYKISRSKTVSVSPFIAKSAENLPFSRSCTLSKRSEGKIHKIRFPQASSSISSRSIFGSFTSTKKSCSFLLFTPSLCLMAIRSPSLRVRMQMLSASLFVRPNTPRTRTALASLCSANASGLRKCIR